MQTRRSVIATLASVGFVSLPGCPLLEDTIEATAEPAIVGEAALAETGYEHDHSREFDVEESVEVGNERRDVNLGNHLAAYSHIPGGTDAQTAQFSVVSSPTVSVAGRDVNPLDQLDDKQLLLMVFEQSDFEGIEDITILDDRTVTVLDDSVEVTRYEATTEVEGIDVHLHLGSTTHEGDFITFVGMHPHLIDHADTVDTLAEGIEHPA